MPFEFTQEFYRSELERTVRRAAGLRLHVFGYGSLMWHPEPRFGRPRLARLHGFSRRLSVYSKHYRGTEENPGLVFGLVAGGSCWGKAYPVARRHQAEMIGDIFAREMFAGVYEPRIVRVFAGPGDALDALTFVARRDHTSFAGRLGLGEQARLVRVAVGSRGPCVDYLLLTHRHLAEEGVPCPNLGRLLDRLGIADRACPSPADGGDGPGGKRPGIEWAEFQKGRPPRSGPDGAGGRQGRGGKREWD